MEKEENSHPEISDDDIAMWEGWGGEKAEEKKRRSGREGEGWYVLMIPMNNIMLM